MFSAEVIRVQLQQWSTILGDEPRPGLEYPGRELWPVTATDGRRYFLKRLGPWRNLPVADQARIQSYLSSHGVRVAEFMITDSARLFAGAVEDSYVLLPNLAHEEAGQVEILAYEPAVGRSVAELHAVLDRYPWRANSYREQIAESLTGDLMLPADVLDDLEVHRTSIVEHLGALPVQLVHGDLIPENVLISRSEPVVSFIDFDHLPLAPRVWDIAKYLARRLRQAPAAALPHVTGFIAGYQQVSRLSEAELAAIPLAAVAMNVLEADWVRRIMVGVLQRRLLPGHEEDLRVTIDTLRWQLHHLPVVVDAVRSPVEPTGAHSPTRRP